MWDPLLDSWTSLAPLQERRGKLALVAAASGHIYAVAGVSGFRQTDNLDTIERCFVLSTCVNPVSIIYVLTVILNLSAVSKRLYCMLAVLAMDHPSVYVQSQV